MQFRNRLLHFCLTFVLVFGFSYGKDRVVVLPGSFQSVLGGNNWDPSGEVTKMKSTDGNIYEFTTVLPAGGYEYKVAINETWDENYGQNGEQDGPNLKLSIKDSYDEVKITFNYKTKKTESVILGMVSEDKFKKLAVKNDVEIKENILLKTSEYIEKSSTETLFLFKTPVGAKIDFYIGEKGKGLKQVVKEQAYEGNGLTIGNLEAGKTYEYKVVSNFLNKKIESPIETYKKENLVIVKDRPEWAKNAVFCEVFVRSFYDKSGDKIGDLAGLKEKLSYYKALGVDGLWLMPITASPSYHGYDVSNYKDVSKDYGTIQDFKDLMAEAKKQNIKIIMDFVINHTSSQHPWAKDVVENNEKSPYKNYYVWADPLDNTKKLGSWGQQVWYNFGDEKFQAVFWSGMPDLNYRNSAVRKEIKDATKFWLDLGLDGFRLDAARYIDDNDEVTKLWWDDFNSYVKSINKNAFIVGENWDNSVDFVGKYMACMDSSFNFNFRDLIMNTAKGYDVSLFDAIQERNEIYGKYNPNFIDTLFIGNHDMTRVATELKNDVKKEKFAMSILMTLPGTPFLYYGEELGQPGNKPDECLREPMDWYRSSKGAGMTSGAFKNGQLAYTKANDGISVEEENADRNSILNFTKKLIKIKKENPMFVTGKYTKLDLGSKVNAYKISERDQALTVIHNSNSNPVEYVSQEGKFTVDSFSTAVIKNGKNLLAE